MKLISWNVQWCCGMDGVVDPQRIARTARALADFDVLCVQEVACNFPGLAGSRGEDQFALLSEALDGYRGFFVDAVDVGDERGGRSRFGNALFTRLPVAHAFRHLLPWPADPCVPSMQRGAIEAVVPGAHGWVRIVTTHLEYYSASQRIAQVHALRALHAETAERANVAPPDEGDSRSPFSPGPRTASALLCGDFNFRPQSIEHALLTAPLAGRAPGLIDAWAQVHPGRAHPPTFRIYDPAWSPYCCDFVFVSADLADRITRIEVDAGTQASDHQPVLVELAV